MLTGNILITGGAGFLGRAILRRAERDQWPARFTIYSRDEEKQFKVRQRWPYVRCILGDIGNLDRLMLAMAGHDLVIHASAVKFVPEAELNVFETVDVNVRGSQNVAMAAHAMGVRRVIGISTDKACMPVNLYGATKMVMERIFGEANNWGSARFIVARYGNVVGSTGSIVPVFKQQLRAMGKVMVTNPDMTRFWLRPDAAVDLISACATLPDEDCGSVIVPTPGAMHIGDLAETIVGMVNGTAIEPLSRFIEVIGPRPGEKVHESLVSDHEAARQQYYPMNGATFRIVRPPGTFTKQRATDGPHAYSSDNPAAWITMEQMAEMIEESETI